MPIVGGFNVDASASVAEYLRAQQNLYPAVVGAALSARQQGWKLVGAGPPEWTGFEDAPLGNDRIPYRDANWTPAAVPSITPLVIFPPDLDDWPDVPDLEPPPNEITPDEVPDVEAGDEGEWDWPEFDDQGWGGLSKKFQSLYCTFIVEVFRTPGGSCGGANEEASWKYEVRSCTGAVLGNTDEYPKAPQLRPYTGKMVQAPNGSYGIAGYDEHGSLILLVACEEHRATKKCP